LHLLLGGGNQRLLFRRNGDIRIGDGNGSLGGIFEAHGLDIIKHLCGHGCGMRLDAAVDDLCKLFLLRDKINFKVKCLFRVAAVHKAEVLRNRAVENHSAERGIDHLGAHLAVDHLEHAALNRSMQLEIAVGICHHRLVKIAIAVALALFSGTVDGQIIGAEHHILRRNGNCAAVDGFEQVVGGKHQETRLSLRLAGKRNMDRHLVAVKVSVERSAYQRMQFDCAPLNQDRLKCLNGQLMQRRRAIEQHGMFLDHIFKRVPNIIVDLFNLLLGILDIRRLLRFDKALHHKRLEQFKRHFLRQTALIKLQRRPDHDNGTAGIVNAFAEQILTEAPLLAAQHLG